MDIFNTNKKLGKFSNSFLMLGDEICLDMKDPPTRTKSSSDCVL